ncbi:MAG: Hpt domain-containing protein [Nitrospinae bacterium]|nr:Hpt domain-containing protein [Nitrospinota bacterium]
MISEMNTRYGVGLRRHGRSRLWTRYQESTFSRKRRQSSASVALYWIVSIVRIGFAMNGMLTYYPQMNAESETVRVDGDLLAIIPQFFDHIRDDIGQLEGASSEAFLKDAAIFGHSLKGTGAAFGFPRLTEMGRELEVGAKSGEQERARELLVSILAYINSVSYTAE